MNRAWWQHPLVSRFVACLAGGVVLAMMVGNQEGTTSSYSLAFRQAVLKPRIFLFLGIGVLLFLAITFWARLVPFLTRAGFWPLISGFLAVVAAQALMHWDDAVGDSKFSTVAHAVADTSSISALTSAFFAWLAWAQLVVIFLVGIAAIILGLRWLALALAGLSIVAAVICYIAHHDVLAKSGGVDHSLGYAAAIIGYLVIASAMLASAYSGGDVANSRAFVTRVVGYRPGLPLVVLGVLLTLLAYLYARWFAPVGQNLSMSSTHSLFDGSGVSSLATSMLGWLGWLLLAGTAVVCAAGAWLRSRLLGVVGALVAAASVILTLVTLYDITKFATASKNYDGTLGTWQNLGAGGWMACAGLFCIGAGAAIAALTRRSVLAVTVPGAAGIAVTPPATRAGSGLMSAPGAARSLVMVAIAAALFYPPTATPFWQQVLVTDIGVAMLLAVGLNVVVGWAGLLDLGFIAFYAIGSYTTAYLVGSLPVKPPSWLHMTPLLAVPFAIAACLIAGLALGAPTLRLRGDYLAIVTLGFGEIIHLSAVNASGITNGNEGLTNDSQTHTKSIPNPSIHIGSLHIHWGLAQLQYWYLLLVFLVIIVVAFRRLEHSRLGRAWAAVREDEVAAQATGINTTKVKLAAFSIGAASSGVAGVFFASQIGTFTPDNFVLNNSILIVAYVVFGGMGSLPGALAGGAMLTWLPQFLKYEVPPSDKLMWIGAIVILMMIFRPAGLVPARRRAAELAGLDQAPNIETVALAASEGL